jgi:hypothetical protein
MPTNYILRNLPFSPGFSFHNLCFVIARTLYKVQRIKRGISISTLLLRNNTKLNDSSTFGIYTAFQRVGLRL